MPRKLRIAVSAFFGLLTVLLLTIWWASFWTCYKIYHFGAPSVMIAVNEGFVAIASAGHNGIPNAWEYHQQPANSAPAKHRWAIVADSRMTTVPFWIPVTFTFVGTLAPVLPPRFSLRALLLATTLVAAVLGLSIWLMS